MLFLDLKQINRKIYFITIQCILKTIWQIISLCQFPINHKLNLVFFFNLHKHVLIEFNSHEPIHFLA